MLKVWLYSDTRGLWFAANLCGEMLQQSILWAMECSTWWKTPDRITIAGHIAVALLLYVPETRKHLELDDRR